MMSKKDKQVKELTEVKEFLRKKHNNAKTKKTRSKWYKLLMENEEKFLNLKD